MKHWVEVPTIKEGKRIIASDLREATTKEINVAETIHKQMQKAKAALKDAEKALDEAKHDVQEIEERCTHKTFHDEDVYPWYERICNGCGKSLGFI